MSGPRITWDQLSIMREQMGLTQKELAYLCGVHLNTAKSWEAPPECVNHRKMRPKFALRVQAIYSRYLRGEIL